jgi:hypothetical protein
LALFAQVNICREVASLPSYYRPLEQTESAGGWFRSYDDLQLYRPVSDLSRNRRRFLRSVADVGAAYPDDGPYRIMA